MSEQKYFRQALQNFMFDAASGGAVRHLADRGFTVDEIMKALDFPTPYDRVQQTVWEHFLDTGYILLEEPGLEKQEETYAYVTDYDQYGRKSFRRVTVSERCQRAVFWKERAHEAGDPQPLSDVLARACAANGIEASYISCDFGLRLGREPERFLQQLQTLDVPLREYVTGIPWERRLVYHRLDERMQEIVVNLYARGAYQGSCYFLKTGEKLRVEGKLSMK